jgi:hypothetical protein
MNVLSALRWRDIADSQGMAACLEAIQSDSLDARDEETAELAETFRRFREAMLTTGQARELRHLIAAAMGRRPPEARESSAEIGQLEARRRELEMALLDQHGGRQERVEQAEKLRRLEARKLELVTAFEALRRELAAERAADRAAGERS